MTAAPGGKASDGNFFEDFALGQEIRHATPRTLTAGDAALYIGLTGSRFPLPCSVEAARAAGYPDSPLDDLLVFHTVFGKTVTDISLNAVANLGYAEGRFLAPVHAGDTLAARSAVIGLRETSNGKAGVVWVRTTGENQRGEAVLEYVRWVMVRKRDEASPAPPVMVPDLAPAVAPDSLVPPAGFDPRGYDLAASGSDHLWDDYAPGERIDHGEGATVEEAEHMLATRLYQNNAKPHFNLHAARETRFERRLVYGGHVISLARALSFNGFANAFAIGAVNAGAHANPVFAGDTIYAWSEVLERIDLPGHAGLGALRLRTVALKDRPAADFTHKDAEGKHDPAVVLDLDYTVFMPRR